MKQIGHKWGPLKINNKTIAKFVKRLPCAEQALNKCNAQRIDIALIKSEFIGSVVWSALYWKPFMGQNKLVLLGLELYE